MGAFRRFWILVPSFFLFSCAGLKDWDMYERYQAEKDFSREKHEKKLLEKRMKKASRKKKEEDIHEKEVKETLVGLLNSPPVPVKVPDTVLRVLILPYVGEDGSLNTSKYVFLKIEEGRWILGDYLIERKKGVRVLTPLKEKGNEGK